MEKIPISLKCRKCRINLIRGKEDLDMHEVGTSTPNDFLYHDYRKHGPKPLRAPECSHVFLLSSEGPERMTPWLRSLLGCRQRTDNDNDSDDGYEGEGPISCPGCKCKLGDYNWVGQRCSCGHWVIPAMGIQRSKVDISYEMVNNNKHI